VLLVIKEAMNNIAKYSEAESAEVRVMLNGSFLLVDISDNGKGFDRVSPNRGNGLVHLKARIESLGGSFQCHSAPGKGTEIHCRIPIPNISDT
jgi:signal transduction histidine kinase